MREVAIRIGGALIIIGIMLGFISRYDFINAFSKPVDIYADEPEQMEKVKGVETEIYMLLDVFAQMETTSKSKSGAVTSRRYDNYYIVPVFQGNETYYVGLEMSSTKAKPYDDIVDATWAYLEEVSQNPNATMDNLDKTAVAFQGGFYKMDDELYDYFEDWFKEAGYFESEAEMKEHLLPIYLQSFRVDTVRNLLIAVIVMIAVGGFLVYLGVRKPKTSRNAANSVITINGVNYPSSNFEKVNRFVEKGKTDKAINELKATARIEQAEAENIISRWHEYWG